MKTAAKLRFASCLSRLTLAARGICGQGDRSIAKRAGLVWELDLREGIDLAIFLFGGFERKAARTLARLTKPRSIVFDIGANIGAHTFNKLRRNLGLNPEIESRVITTQAK
jgi:hypothetical protein